MGFEETPHSADWSVRVWAEDLSSLFAESARAMYALTGTEAAQTPRAKRTFESAGLDLESQLVAFLSELIYYQEQENLAFDTFEIQMSIDRISVTMLGAGITSLEKEIKAVTFHNLRIEETERGFEAMIIFDV